MRGSHDYASYRTNPAYRGGHLGLCHRGESAMRPRSVLGLVSAYEFGNRRGERRAERRAMGEKRRHPLLLVIAGLALLVLAGMGALTSPGAPPTETTPTLATSTALPPPSAPAESMPLQPAAPSATSLLPPAASLVPLPGVPGAFTGGNR